MQCPDCNFSNSSKKMFKEHRKQHQPQGPLQCDQCSYHGATKSALANHMITHSDIKAHHCKFCDYASKQSGNMKTHMRRKHATKLPLLQRRAARKVKRGDEPMTAGSVDKRPSAMKPACRQDFGCHLCTERFVRDDSLRSHLKWHRDSDQPVDTSSIEVQQSSEEQSTQVSSQTSQHVQANYQAVADTQSQQTTRIQAAGLMNESNANTMPLTEPSILQAALAESNITPGGETQSILIAEPATTKTEATDDYKPHHQSYVLSQADSNSLAIMQNQQNLAVEDNMHNLAISNRRDLQQQALQQQNDEEGNQIATQHLYQSEQQEAYTEDHAHLRTETCPSDIISHAEGSVESPQHVESNQQVIDSQAEVPPQHGIPLQHVVPEDNDNSDVMVVSTEDGAGVTEQLISQPEYVLSSNQEVLTRADVMTGSRDIVTNPSRVIDNAGYMTVPQPVFTHPESQQVLTNPLTAISSLAAVPTLSTVIQAGTQAANLPLHFLQSLNTVGTQPVAGVPQTVQVIIPASALGYPGTGPVSHNPAVMLHMPMHQASHLLHAIQLQQQVAQPSNVPPTITGDPLTKGGHADDSSNTPGES